MTSPAAEAPASSTPILDRVAPLPRPEASGSGSRIGLVAGIAVFLAVLAVVVLWNPPFVGDVRRWILASLEESFPGGWTPGRVIFVVLLGALIGLSVTAIHELGHVIVGCLVGFRCSSMFIGPLQLHVPFRVSLHPDPRAWLHGGATLFPVERDRLRARGIAMVFAGPAANLLTGVAVLLWPSPKGFFSGFFIVSSILAGVVELLVPLRGPTFVFDGRRILMMLRHPELGERWLALMRLGADVRSGVLPEALPADFLAKAIAVRDESAETVAAHALAYAAAFHQKRDSEAGRMLETSLAHSSRAAPVVREALMSDAAVFQARRRRRADLAEQWLAAMPTTTNQPWFRSRAEAAIREASGDVDGAIKKLAEGETAALALPAGAQREAQLRLLQRWRSDLGVVEASADLP